LWYSYTLCQHTCMKATFIGFSSCNQFFFLVLTVLMMSKGICLLCAVCWCCIVCCVLNCVVLCAVCWIVLYCVLCVELCCIVCCVLYSLNLLPWGMHIQSFITTDLMKTSCLFKITIRNSTFIEDIFVKKHILLFLLLYKAWWWAFWAETCSWLLTDYCYTINIVVLTVILLKKTQDASFYEWSVLKM
jgi:hypothetical protein